MTAVPPQTPGDGRVTLVLPWPPTINSYWRHVGGKVLISKDGREFRKLVVAATRDAVASPLTGRLAVAVLLRAPDRRRYDIDNRLKALLDAITCAGVWEDDGQVDAIVACRREPFRPCGMAVVAIAPMPDDAVAVGDAQDAELRKVFAAAYPRLMLSASDAGKGGEGR